MCARARNAVKRFYKINWRKNMQAMLLVFIHFMSWERNLGQNMGTKSRKKMWERNAENISWNARKKKKNGNENCQKNRSHNLFFRSHFFFMGTVFWQKIWFRSHIWQKIWFRSHIYGNEIINFGFRSHIYGNEIANIGFRSHKYGNGIYGNDMGTIWERIFDLFPFLSFLIVRMYQTLILKVPFENTKN